MSEKEVLARLQRAMAGRSPETVVQELGLPYNQSRILRNAIARTGGLGKKVLGILLMLDADAGPAVLEFLKEGVRCGNY